MLSRRTMLLGACILATTGTPALQPAYAQQAYPTRPIKIIIPNPPGGDDDTLARFMAPMMAAELGQPVVVENRGGGASTVGGMAVAQAAPDGYTLLSLHTAGLIQTVLRDKLQYSLKSFTPIVGIGGYPMALVVSPSSNIQTFDDLKAVASKPDGITFASAGAGTLGHLTAVRFLKAIQGNSVHVSYKNNPEGLQSLAGGFTQMMFPSAREAANLRKDGLLRVIAVTSPQRTGNLPDVPTTAELGLPTINSKLWYGYAAPAGTPPEVISRLADVIQKAVQSPAFKERFEPLSFQSDLMTGDAFAQFLAAESTRWREVVVENNVRFTD
jgi:tripartite-type tricarboxylate transporter receptor subunit TctC